MKPYFSVLLASALVVMGHAATTVETTANTTASCGLTTVPFHRGWDASIGDHFYTTDADEMLRAVAPNAGYIYQGNAAQVLSFQQGHSVALWRLYSGPQTDHFYTTDDAERARAIQQYGYIDEGIAAWVFETQECGTVPLYRLFNPEISDHFYTTSATERDQAIQQLGYNDEGIAAYVNPQ